MTIKSARLAAFAALCASLAGCFGSQTSTLIQPTPTLENIKRIAVLPFQSQHGNGLAMSDAMVTEFMSAGFYVVDRGLLEGVFRSLSLDFDAGALKPEELVAVGKATNVDAVVFGTLHADSEKLGGDIQAVSLRMVAVQNGEVVLSSTFKNEKLLLSHAIAPEMMDNILSRLKKYRRAMERGRRKAEKARRKAEKAEAARLEKERKLSVQKDPDVPGFGKAGEERKNPKNPKKPK